MVSKINKNSRLIADATVNILIEDKVKRKENCKFRIKIANSAASKIDNLLIDTEFVQSKILIAWFCLSIPVPVFFSSFVIIS